MKQYFILFMFVLFFSWPSAADEIPELPRLKVDGNWLVTPDGAPVTLRGVSLCSLSWHNPMKLLSDVAHKEQGWKVNAVRLPVQPEEWARLGPLAYIKERLDPAVEHCRRSGLYCMIDWHEIADWDKEDTARRLEGFWRVVAPRYADEPFILYEIFNEPIGPGKRNRKNWLAFREQAQKWVDMVRAEAPETIILIGSPHWSQMPGFAAQDPFEGEDLVYVAHIYGTWPREAWDEIFGNAAKTVPLFVTEWGWSSLARNRREPFYGTLTDYAAPFKAYVSARPQISWTAWSYDPACGPAMLGSDAEMGDFVKNWLEEENSPPPKEGEG